MVVVDKRYLELVVVGTVAVGDEFAVQYVEPVTNVVGHVVESAVKRAEIGAVEVVIAEIELEVETAEIQLGKVLVLLEIEIVEVTAGIEFEVELAESEVEAEAEAEIGAETGKEILGKKV